MSDKPMSKYAAKRQRRFEEADRAACALDVALRITAGTMKPTLASASIPAAPQTQKVRLNNHRFGKISQPKRTLEIGDLGELPAKCADALDRAAKLLEFAETCAEQMVSVSASRYQTAEPRAMAQFCLSMKLKVSAMATRAKAIPSKQ